MKRLALFLAALSALVVSCKKDNVYELILSPESPSWSAQWIGGSSPEDRIWGGVDILGDETSVMN